MSDKFTIFDIHFFSNYYDGLIEELKRREKKVKITIWGSDFYRVDKVRREAQRKIYKIVDIIQIETTQIANDFLQVYPECSEKIRIAHFGLSQFDIIDELLKKGDCDYYKKEWKIPENKIVLMCGTNRSEGQQHLMILESIKKLSPEIKAQIFLILPLTYGGHKSYIKIVREKVNSLGLPYKIVQSFLSLHEITKLILISDILISIQVTDALSCTIQEHLYAGNIIILGSWLPYRILNENEVVYLTTSLENLSGTLSETIEDIKSLKNLCKGNKKKLTKLSSWDEAIKAWLTIYGELDSKLKKLKCIQKQK